jgi:endo-1,4-beta-xylanase
MNKPILLLLLLLFILPGCGSKETENVNAVVTVKPSLKEKFKKDFYIGAAINGLIIDQTDTSSLKVLKREFNSITAENDMKWMNIHPKRDTFNFKKADQFIALAEEEGMHTLGHTLVWHSQLARYVYEVKDSAEMAAILKEHISEIVGKYKGRINSWDVVNEALNEDGTLRESVFLKVMGPGFIDLAFKLAAEADPEAELIYNDYNLWKPEKRDGVVRLVKELQSNGTKIDGVGMQAHWNLKEPSLEDVENSILAYSDLGVKVMFTELDITVLPNPWDLEGAGVEQNFSKFERDSIMNPFPEQLPDSMQVKLAKRYEDIFNLFVKHSDKISRVTFWGIDDGKSWLNNWPIRGRTNYPLLFDRNLEPKMAYESVMELKTKTH